MPIDTSKTGAAIAAHRQRMNLSQQGLAGLMNVTHQAVSKWEKGLALPDTETLLALAKLFGSSMEDLLQGVLPVQETPAAKASPVEEASAEEVETASGEWGQLDFGSIMNMLPFASSKVADQLLLTYCRSEKPDIGQLTAIAPFVSDRALSECIGAHPLTDCSPEILLSLAPFLSTKAVDDLIKGMNGSIPPHIMQSLMPFASSKVVDEMVLNKLGMKADAPDSTNDSLPNGVEQKMEMLQQKIQQQNERIQQRLAERRATFKQAHQPSPTRESPRIRLLRRIIERSNQELAVEMAEGLDYQELETVCLMLMENGLYDALSEVMENLNEAAIQRLIDKALEIDDPELLHIIGEHI